jgi:uncharacterized membrane protein YecN with MAPEG domain
MELVYVTVLLALLEYTVMAAFVGRARAKHAVLAPATTGHPEFERAYRVHINTLENLIVFVPGVVLFGLYVSELWAAALGVIFVVGRAVYAYGYYQAAEKRGIGAGLTGIVCIVLIVGGLIGLGRALL